MKRPLHLILDSHLNWEAKPYLHKVSVSRESTTETVFSWQFGGVAGINQDPILTSSNDGITWDNRTSGTQEGIYGVTYGNGFFLTVGDSGTILTSTDGTTCTSRASGITENLYGITYKE